MRAMQRALWCVMLFILACLGFAAGCVLDNDDHARAEDSAAETTPDEDPLPGTSDHEPECPGKCVAEPPAPFNGKVHLIWIGPESAIPECPPSAKHVGHLAQIVSMEMDGQPERGEGQWVRECLISTDPAPCEEGQTCAPLPPEDYELCISRQLSGFCTTGDYPRHIVAQEPGEPPPEPLTLCCTRRKHR